MAKQNINSKQGFTIIEVVLVLAIAGLIFLMVFVALPALQRSQRDTARRNDMSRLATALTNWQTNHDNSLPSSAQTATLLTDYLKSGNGEFKDPDGTNYTIQIGEWTSSNTGATNGTTAHQINIVTKAKCNNETAAQASGATNYAILYKLEGSGTVCVDNQ